MLAAAMLAAASGQAAAEANDDSPWTSIGQGNRSCGSWTQVRSTKSAQNGLYAQWLAGFVSGVNWAITDPPDILTGMDFEALAAWVDNYCKANPIERVSTAAIMLVQELQARARR
jgi:hypothetical protein